MNHRVLVAFSFVALVSGCPSDPEPTDSGPVDARGTTPDAPRDAPPRPDAPRAPDGLDAQRDANASFIPVFCHCVAPRVDPPITEAACVTQNEPDEPFRNCEREGFDAAPTAVEAYYQCLATAIMARETCWAASDCSEAATDACDATQDTANDACRDLLTDPVGGAAFDMANADCIRDTIIGTVAGDCLEPGAVSTGTGSAVFEGETVLGGDDTDPNPSCAGAAGRGAADRGHRWRATEAGVYHFDTMGSEFDTVLYVREGCEMQTLGCSDDIEAGVVTVSAFDVVLAAGQEVVVIVDGFGQAARGHYEVNINYLGAADAGPGGPDAGPSGTDAGPPGTDAGSADDDAGPAPDDAGVDAP